MKNNVHLCDSCKDDFPECSVCGEDIKFGNGKGDDNIIACPLYTPITKKTDLVQSPIKVNDETETPLDIIKRVLAQMENDTPNSVKEWTKIVVIGLNDSPGKYSVTDISSNSLKFSELLGILKIVEHSTIHKALIEPPSNFWE